MRIAFVTDKSAPQFTGGYETRVFELATRLARRHQVRVYTSLTAPSMSVRGVRFERICPVTFQRDLSGRRSLAHSTLFGASLAWNRLADFRPDATVVEAIPYVHLVSMARWARLADSVLLVDVLEAWEQFRYTDFPIAGDLSAIIIHRCLATGLEWADSVLAISKATAESLVQNYGLKRSEISIVPLGHPESEIVESVTENSEDKEFDFITVGRLVTPKRVSDFLRALAILRTDHAWRGRAAVLGSGPLRIELEQEASRLGLDRQVVFTGFVTDQTKASFLRRSRVFVLPSEREGFSLATLEAMYHSLPVVVARPLFGEVFGTSDFVFDGENGLHFPVGDVSALAGVLSKTVLSQQLYQSLSKSALETASRYTWESAADRLEGTIQAVRQSIDTETRTK